jgi:acyl-CoA oxidase
MSSDQEWSAAFSAATADLADGMTYAQASQRLRTLIASNLLQPTDIVKRPQRFFEAHRILSRHAARLGPGFWIRFTVHFNLFAGTVVALGTPQQIQALEDRCRQRPLLGCFGLTEVLAGVNSGLVVNTTAEFKDGKIVINSPNKQAAKNWISQVLNFVWISFELYF